MRETGKSMDNDYSSLNTNTSAAHARTRCTRRNNESRAKPTLISNGALLALKRAAHTIFTTLPQENEIRSRPIECRLARNGSNVFRLITAPPNGRISTVFLFRPQSYARVSRLRLKTGSLLLISFSHCNEFAFFRCMATVCVRCRQLQATIRTTLFLHCIRKVCRV